MDIVVGVNSYVDIDYADEYFSGYFYNSFWTSSTDEEKTRALITATDMIDNGFVWFGEKTDPNQPLAFPRYSDVDNIGCGFPNDPNEVPEAVKQATCLQAQYLMEFPDLLKPVTNYIKKTKMDVMEVEYFLENYKNLSWIYEIVQNRLRLCYGTPISQSNIQSYYFKSNVIRN